ncbi:hypothetical protein TNCV_2769081 [Trichonephila clavipes]|nr:hypothetical protein TNCV_2769081 [Trichonephila clavipes]
MKRLRSGRPRNPFLTPEESDQHSHVHPVAADKRLRRGRPCNPRLLTPEESNPANRRMKRDALNLLGSGGQRIPPLTNYWTLEIFK